MELLKLRTRYVPTMREQLSTGESTPYCPPIPAPSHARLLLQHYVIISKSFGGIRDEPHVPLFPSFFLFHSLSLSFSFFPLANPPLPIPNLSTFSSSCYACGCVNSSREYLVKRTETLLTPRLLFPSYKNERT